MALKLNNFPKEDCFAFKHSGYDGCNALVQLECKFGHKPCPFYKPKSEMKDYEIDAKKKGWC